MPIGSSVDGLLAPVPVGEERFDREVLFLFFKNCVCKRWGSLQPGRQKVASNKSVGVNCSQISSRTEGVKGSFG